MTALEGIPIRDDLRGQSPYGAPQIDVAVRLNTNENPFPPPPGLVDDVVSAMRLVGEGLNRYPDREAVELRTQLAGYLGHGLTAAHTWAANGSNEVLQQICQAFGGPGRLALGFEPSYSMHSLIARATSTPWVGASRADDFTLPVERAVDAVRHHQPTLVFLCSPNNPTATALDPAVVEAVLDVAPGMVVVDEAYAEFSHRPSALRLLEGHPRLIVTRTMSKAFAFAGARLGYLAADPAVVDALRLVRLPYHLSAVTQAAALAALRHADETLATVAELRRQRDALVEWFGGRPGLQAVESDANFVLFGRFADQARVWQALVRRGVLVRDVGLPGWLRVTVSYAEEMAAFTTALSEVMEELR